MPTEPVQNLIVNVLIQVPIVTIILWVVDRRDKQWQTILKGMSDQIAAAMEKVTSSNDALREKIACMATADEVAKKLSNEFWGRRRGDNVDGS